MKTIIVLSSLALSLACSAEDGAHAPVKSKLAIVSASFGVGDSQIDVTRAVGSLVSHELVVLRSPWALGAKDPVPNHAKQVQIVYRYNGVENTAIFGQDQNIILPPPPEKGLVIVNASFGIRDRRVDVTEAVRSAVTNDHVHVPSVWSWSISDVDPMEGTTKSVQIMYLQDGKLKTVSFSEKEDIVLPKPAPGVSANPEQILTE